MARKPPHRYVPTLTEVVQPAAPPQPSAPAPSGEEIVARVMERIEPALEGRLREAIAAIAIEQTRALAPWLREQIEGAVRQAVAEALDDSGRPGPEAPRG